jgi:hypothetical protein
MGLLALCLAVPASAEMAPTEVCAFPAQSVNAYIEGRLAFWQAKLDLAGWKISATPTRRSDLKAKTLGGIRWDKGKKTAQMAVMDAADYTIPCNEMLADMEFTIVHELVHLELASLPKSEASRSNEEYAVNRLAEALLKLHRGE